MKIFLTSVFLYAWLLNLYTRTQNWDNVFWWGLVIVLCGAYFSLDEMKKITHNEEM